MTMTDQHRNPAHRYNLRRVPHARDRARLIVVFMPRAVWAMVMPAIIAPMAWMLAFFVPDEVLSGLQRLREKNDAMGDQLAAEINRLEKDAAGVPDTTNEQPKGGE